MLTGHNMTLANHKPRFIANQGLSQRFHKPIMDKIQQPISDKIQQPISDERHLRPYQYPV